jgi:hypothetical protein
MGLRIIDRQFKRKALIPEAERLSLLVLETQRWSDVKGDVDSRSQERFISNFKRVKACLDSPDAMVEKAARIRQDILDRRPGAEISHTKVDITTLLELLDNRGEM